MGHCMFLRKGETHTVPTKPLPEIGMALEAYTWEQIRAISDAGLASQYFYVGQRKSVYMSGAISTGLSLDGTYYVYIIGFNHNAELEGSNRIHFQFGFTGASGGNHIAFIDGAYGTNSAGSSHLVMNYNNTNAGGWASSWMRTARLPSIKNAMPSELRSVLKPVTKYTDNTGGGSDTASYVTATEDTIFLLSEFEMHGRRSYANSAEQAYQAQYAYYAAGNSKAKYRYNDTSTACTSWTRSPACSYSTAFCRVQEYPYQDGSYFNAAKASYGIAPAFCV